MNHDYVIFVLPMPRRWLSLVIAVLCFGLSFWILWQRRQLSRRVAHIAEPLVDICQRHGFTDEAESIQRDVDRLRGGFLGRRRRRDEQQEAAA